jgi:hypothetical protein
MSAGDGDDATWLLLVYRVPSEPTRLRAAVWRRLKSLGAIYLQNSAAALPASVGAERALRKLRREILDMSGTAVLLSCSVLAGEPGVLRRSGGWDDEYAEIVDKCQDFSASAQRVRGRSLHLRWAGENEVDLVAPGTGSPGSGATSSGIRARGAEQGLTLARRPSKVRGKGLRGGRRAANGIDD